MRVFTLWIAIFISRRGGNMTKEEMSLEINKLKMEIEELKHEFAKFKEEKDQDTGVFLDGAPDYIKEYCKKDVKGAK